MAHKNKYNKLSLFHRKNWGTEILRHLTKKAGVYVKYFQSFMAHVVTLHPKQAFIIL